MKRILRTVAVSGIAMGAAVLAAPSAMADINFYAVEKAYVGHNGPTYVSEKGPGDLMFTDIVKSPHAKPVIGNKPVKTGDITTTLHGGKHNTAVTAIEGSEQESTKKGHGKGSHEQAAPLQGEQQAAPQQDTLQAAPQQGAEQAAPQQDAQQAAQQQGAEQAAPQQDAQQAAQQQDAQQNAPQQGAEQAAPQQDAQQAAQQQGAEQAAPQQDAQQAAPQQDAQQNAPQQGAEQAAPQQDAQQAAQQQGAEQAAPQQDAQQAAQEQGAEQAAPESAQRRASNPDPKEVNIHAVKKAAVGQNGPVRVSEKGPGDAIFTNFTASPRAVAIVGNKSVKTGDISTKLYDGKGNTVVNSVSGSEQESNKR
ncbi:hypothetical protein ACQPZP_06875 [Spirillospora sp. CA-142024]|uniref:hypothetical protein n=1 Tax=Spirillospora sp. CA-142024 TaxID=3240036 RepID=UPI003D8ADDB7